MWSFPPGQRATFQWNSGDVTAVVAVQGRTGVDGWRRNNSALISSLTEVKFVMSVGSTPCSSKEKHSLPPVTVQANKEQENIEICVTFDVTIQWSAQQKLQVWGAESPLAPPCVSSPPQAVFFPSRRLAAKTGKSLTPKKRHDSSYLDELGRLSVLYICKRENWESVKKAIILINNTYLKKIKMCRPFNLLILNEQQIIQKWMKNKLPDSRASTPWKTTCPSPMEHIHTL